MSSLRSGAPRWAAIPAVSASLGLTFLGGPPGAPGEATKEERGGEVEVL